MNYTQTPIEGVHLIEERPHNDERGFFSRKYCQNELPVPIAQINHSQSRLRGTLRGLHYQEEPHQEIKIVSCIKGKIWDVVVDLRKDSPTFHKYFGIELYGPKSLLIPKGCAHGFITLEDNSEILYFVSEFYHPESEKGIRYNDPKIAIEWPIPPTTISEKDLSYENIV